ERLARIEKGELLVVWAEVGEADPEKPDGGPARSRTVEQVSDHRVELELGARGRDRTRAQKRLEIRVPQLQRDRSRLHAAPASAPANAFAERAEHRLDARRVADVFAERPLVGNRADGAARRIVFLECGALAAELVRAEPAAIPLDGF